MASGTVAMDEDAATVAAAEVGSSALILEVIFVEAAGGYFSFVLEDIFLWEFLEGVYLPE